MLAIEGVGSRSPLRGAIEGTHLRLHLLLGLLRLLLAASSVAVGLWIGNAAAILRRCWGP
jgi:hypothetical protein